MDKVITFCKAVYNAALVGVTSYELGKNSAIPEKQVVIAAPKVENTPHNTVDLQDGIYALIGLVVIVIIAFLIKELHKCIRCVKPAPIEMVNLNPNNNRNNNNNGAVHVNV